MKLVIEPGRTAKNYWRDLWQYRELMYFLAWRDITVRYKQTVIGVVWALIRPALTMLVFVVLRRLAGFPPGTVPEPILVFAAVLPWQFFSTALSESSASLVGNANLISRVYFPRLIIPCAAAVNSLVDFLITLGLLAVLMAWYGFAPGWQIAALPLFVVLALTLSVGLGLLLAALNVAIFALSCRSSCSSGCSFPRSPSARPTCRKAGALFTRSIRWSASSTASVGRCSPATRPCISTRSGFPSR